MSKTHLSRTVGPGVGVSLPATIEEMKEAHSLLNETDTVPLETATTYVESSVPNLRQYLYEVPVSEEGLGGLNYLAYRAKWMDSQDEAVFGTVIEMMKPETLRNITNLSRSMDKFKYLPGMTTGAKLGGYLLKEYLDMTMEERTIRFNYRWIGKDYIRKHGDMFHAFGCTGRIQKELEPIYGGNELPDPDFKQTCSFKVWIYKGNPYGNYTLTLLAVENKMNALKSAMRASDWSECKQLGI